MSIVEYVFKCQPHKWMEVETEKGLYNVKLTTGLHDSIEELHIDTTVSNGYYVAQIENAIDTAAKYGIVNLYLGSGEYRLIVDILESYE